MIKQVHAHTDHLYYSFGPNGDLFSSLFNLEQLFCAIFHCHLNRVVRKSDFCLCETKDEGQHLWFRYTSSTYIQNFKIRAFFCDCTEWFVSDLVGNPEDRFSSCRGFPNKCKAMEKTRRQDTSLSQTQQAFSINMHLIRQTFVLSTNGART